MSRTDNHPSGLASVVALCSNALSQMWRQVLIGCSSPVAALRPQYSCLCRCGRLHIPFFGPTSSVTCRLYAHVAVCRLPHRVRSMASCRTPAASAKESMNSKLLFPCSPGCPRDTLKALRPNHSVNRTPCQLRWQVPSGLRPPVAGYVKR